MAIPLIVYGAGGDSQVVLETIRRQGVYEVMCLLDDEVSTHGQKVLGFRIVGGGEQVAGLLRQGVRHFVAAIGDNDRRRRVSERLVGLGLRAATLVDPSAIVLSESRIGAGTVILGHAQIGVRSVLGEGCIVSVSCVVGHDCQLGRFAQLAPGVVLGGEVRIGDGTFLGLNVSAIPRVTIGRDVLVGAGSAVVDDLGDGVTAVGVPARPVSGSDASGDFG
jgi:sugar O-acyltransferase (sialic acid O-acetyltransferase NeuD family)